MKGKKHKRRRDAVVSVRILKELDESKMIAYSSVGFVIRISLSRFVAPVWVSTSYSRITLIGSQTLVTRAGIVTIHNKTGGYYCFTGIFFFFSRT